MIETQQEKRQKIGALHREIADARLRYGNLTDQLDELREINLPGYEPQIALLTTEIKNCEKIVEAAAREVLIRTGQPVLPVKRGPGRPPKAAA